MLDSLKQFLQLNRKKCGILQIGKELIQTLDLISIPVVKHYRYLGIDLVNSTKDLKDK
jgi:hypothetical protein